MLLGSSNIGLFAGLATSVLWTGTSLSFTAAAQRLGATFVNAMRITLAVAFLGVTHLLLTGHWIPELLPRQTAYLAASGILGLAVGDQALFVAFVLIGPRLAMLIMTTSPLAAALLGWLVLGETLAGWGWLGVALTVGGVAWVVLERSPKAPGPTPRGRWRGVALAFVGAVCQAGGLLLSKQGIGHGWLPEAEHLDAQAATLVRMAFAGLGMIPIITWHRFRERRRNQMRAPMTRRTRSVGWMCLVTGAVLGPYLGVWLSLVAADKAALGVAQTLCSLSPVFILPFCHVVFRERVSRRAVVGAIIAVAGVAVLFLLQGGEGEC